MSSQRSTFCVDRCGRCAGTEDMFGFPTCARDRPGRCPIHAQDRRGLGPCCGPRAVRRSGCRFVNGAFSARLCTGWALAEIAPCFL